MKKIYSLIIIFLITLTAVAQAPTLVFDINPGTGNASPSSITLFNNQLYFSGDDSSGTNTGMMDLGRELWVSDGTPTGTNLVLDINPGSSSGAPFNVFEFNNALYFTANDGSSELWTTDGTATGTTKVDLIPTETGEAPNRATVYNNSVFFTALVNGGTNQLVEWDGVAAGALAADAVNPTATTNVSALSVFNNLIYLYMEYSPDEATIGRELYTYDPATDTYTLILDVATGTANSGISNFTGLGSTLYFEALGDLWQTDGTPAGTIEVPAAATLAFNGVLNLFAFNDFVLFEGDNGTGDQLWALNTLTGTIAQVSTNAGTNTNHDPSDYAIYNGMVYYRGEDSNDTDGHLYVTDGITTTQLDSTIKDVDEITVWNNKLYFEGDEDTVTGNELFVYDPATASIDTVASPRVSLYPNPNNGNFQLANHDNNFTDYSIYDLSGRMIDASPLSSNTIQANLAQGIYVLQLNGENIATSIKFVVE